MSTSRASRVGRTGKRRAATGVGGGWGDSREDANRGWGALPFFGGRRRTVGDCRGAKDESTDGSGRYWRGSWSTIPRTRMFQQMTVVMRKRIVYVARGLSLGSVTTCPVHC